MKIQLFTIFIIMVLSINFARSQNNGKIMVYKEDTTLKIDKRYDDAYRNKFGLGAAVGVDGSATSAAVLLDVSGYFTLKHLILRTNYSYDLTGSNLISSNNPLMKKGQAYSNFQISAFFNILDKAKDLNQIAIVGTENAGYDKFKHSYMVKVYSINQPVNIRTTFGFGGSLILSKHNLAYTTNSNNSPGFITFENNAPAPEHFIMPYDLVIIGLGINYSTFTSHYYKYQYKQLKPWKLKSSQVAIQQIEFLFSPVISYSESILTITGNSENMMKVESVKKFPFGFRVLRHSVKKNKPGLFYTAELGMRPGIYDKLFPNSIYARITIGLTI